VRATLFMTESQISKLIVTAYEAAAEPALWSSFLTQYSDVVKAGVCGFQIHHFSEHRSETLWFVRLPLELRQSYQAYYTKLNPWREQGQRLYVQGRMLRSDSDNVLASHDFMILRLHKKFLN
jgi:hypothetical protein